MSTNPAATPDPGTTDSRGAPAGFVAPVGVDELDVLIADAMLLAALGPDSDALWIDRTGPAPVVTLTPLARNVLVETSASRRVQVHAGWLELLLPALVEHTVDILGETARADAGRVCSQVALTRAVQLHTLLTAARTAPLTIASSATVAATLASAVLAARDQTP